MPRTRHYLSGSPSHLQWSPCQHPPPRISTMTDRATNMCPPQWSQVLLMPHTSLSQAIMQLILQIFPLNEFSKLDPCNFSLDSWNPTISTSLADGKCCCVPLPPLSCPSPGTKKLFPHRILDRLKIIIRLLFVRVLFFLFLNRCIFITSYATIIIN